MYPKSSQCWLFSILNCSHISRVNGPIGRALNRWKVNVSQVSKTYDRMPEKAWNRYTSACCSNQNSTFVKTCFLYRTVRIPDVEVLIERHNSDYEVQSKRKVLIYVLMGCKWMNEYNLLMMLGFWCFFCEKYVLQISFCRRGKYNVWKIQFVQIMKSGSEKGRRESGTSPYQFDVRMRLKNINNDLRNIATNLNYFQVKHFTLYYGNMFRDSSGTRYSFAHYIRVHLTK